MSKVEMSTSTCNLIVIIANTTLQSIRDKIDDWQETYDERECNEPEYDSQIDRWQEALDRLEEKIETATYLADDYESWIDTFESSFDTQSALNAKCIFDVDEDGIAKTISDLTDFNSEYRGLTPILKKMNDIPMFIRLNKI